MMTSSPLVMTEIIMISQGLVEAVVLRHGRRGYVLMEIAVPVVALVDPRWGLVGVPLSTLLLVNEHSKLAPSLVLLCGAPERWSSVSTGGLLG